MSEPAGLRRVLDVVGPQIRAGALTGEIVAATFAAPVIAASIALAHHCTLVVTSTANEAEQLRSSIAAYWGFDDEVGLWPGWDTHPLERVSPDLSVMGRRHEMRWRLAREELRPSVIVASVRSLAQLLTPEKLDGPMQIVRGQLRERGQLLSELVNFGYRREHAVEHRGEFAVRGGIVDCWPTQLDEPIRVDLFGDEVERLTVFDVADQRSLRDCGAIDIFAAREWRLDDAARRRAERLSLELPWGRESFRR